VDLGIEPGEAVDSSGYHRSVEEAFRNLFRIDLLKYWYFPYLGACTGISPLSPLSDKILLLLSRV
jgi:hypothetical protein